MSTTCPNLLPSLDHPSGFYCRAECGGNCHGKTLSFEPGAVVWKEMEYYQQRVWVAFTINDDGTATGEALVNGSTIVDTLVVNRCFKRGARSQPPNGARIGDEIRYYLDAEQTMPIHFPMGNVSDSANPRRSSDSGSQDFTLENLSDSANPRESHHWTDADPGDEDDQLYEAFCQGGRFWHEAGEYTSKGRRYYRYRWGRGHRIEGVRHIPGGSLRRELVKERAALVERAVYVDFRPHHEIVALIDGWRSRTRCHK